MIKRYHRTHQRIKTKTDNKLSLDRARSEAWETYPGTKDNSILVGWYDHDNRTGAPGEVARDEPFRAALDYARANGMTAEVRVNDSGYSFFFRNKPEDTRELDPEMVEEIHEGLDQHMGYANLQGG